MRTPAALLAIALLALAGCGAVSAPSSAPGSVTGSPMPSIPAVTPPSTASSAGPLITVERRGGHCRQGSCDTTIAIERDGRVHATLPEPRELGTLPPEPFQEVQQELSLADFERLASRPFTGECPVNFDGQELIYTFHAATGPIRLASCEVEIDLADPLFAAIERALSSVEQP